MAALAIELIAWMQVLALTGTDAKRWEPKRLRLRLFPIAHHVRRTHLRLSAHASCNDLLEATISAPTR